MSMKQILVFLALGLIGTVLLSGCVHQPPPEEALVPQAEEMKSATAWMDVELTDVATGDEFKISDFKGKPIEKRQ